MSTRSIIALRKDNGHYESIYCHRDGYEEKPGVGYILKMYYVNEDKIQQLIQLGNLSFINETTVSAYHRDWGRDWASNQPKTSPSYSSLVNLAKRCIADYLYVFTNGQWECQKVCYEITTI